jgi:hypothetical protein
MVHIVLFLFLEPCHQIDQIPDKLATGKFSGMTPLLRSQGKRQKAKVKRVQGSE